MNQSESRGLWSGWLKRAFKRARGVGRMSLKINGEPGLAWLGGGWNEPERQGRWFAARYPEEAQAAVSRSRALWLAPLRPGKLGFGNGDLNQHMLMLGTTGTGKSSFGAGLVRLMVLSMMNEDGRGAGVAFERRALEALTQPGWEVGPDEALDERHPMVAMAFASACEDAERAYEKGLEAIGAQDVAVQIARRLSGLPAAAPSEDWLDGMLQSAQWSALRDRVAARVEALQIESAAARPEGDGRARAAKARSL